MGIHIKGIKTQITPCQPILKYSITNIPTKAMGKEISLKRNCALISMRLKSLESKLVIFPNSD